MFLKEEYNKKNQRGSLERVNKIEREKWTKVFKTKNKKHQKNGEKLIK